jgi:tetratricopeptide (TPR) repeat protein
MQPLDTPIEKSERARWLRRLPLVLWAVPLICLAGAAAHMAHNRYPTGWDSDMHARNAIAFGRLLHEAPVEAWLFLRQLPLHYPPLTYAVTGCFLALSFSPWAHHATILLFDTAFLLFFALSLRALKLRPAIAWLGLLAVCADPRLAVNLCSYNLEMGWNAAAMFLTWLWLTQRWRRSARAGVFYGMAAGVALLSKAVILPFFALILVVEFFVPLPGAEEKHRGRLALFAGVAGLVAAAHYGRSAATFLNELTGDLRGFPAGKAEPWWRYAAVLIFGLGGSPLLLSAALLARRVAWRRLPPAAGRLAAMAGLWLVFFSLFATKRPWYAVGPYSLVVLAATAALNSAEGTFARRVTGAAGVLYATAALLFWFPQTRMAAAHLVGVADRDLALPTALATRNMSLDAFAAVFAEPADCRTFVIDPTREVPPAGLKTVLSFVRPDAVIGGGFIALPTAAGAASPAYAPDVCAAIEMRRDDSRRAPPGVRGADNYERAALFLQNTHDPWRPAGQVAGSGGSLLVSRRTVGRDETPPPGNLSCFDSFLLFNEYLPPAAVRDRLRSLCAGGETAQALTEYQVFLPMRRGDSRVWNEFFDCLDNSRTPAAERQAMTQDVGAWLGADDSVARETCLRRLCDLEVAGKIAGRCEDFAETALAGPTLAGADRSRLLRIVVEFLLQTGRDADAEALLDRDASADDAAALVLHFAASRRDAGDVDRALEVFRLALSRRPDDPAALAGLIATLRAAHRPDDEAAAIERALAALPGSAVVFSDHFARLFALGGEASCLRWIARTFVAEPPGSPSRDRALDVLLRRPFPDALRERVDELLASNLPPASSSEMPATLWDWAQAAWEAGNAALAGRLHDRIADNSAFGDACRRVAQTRAELLRAGVDLRDLRRGAAREKGLRSAVDGAVARLEVFWRGINMTSERRAQLREAAPWSRLTGVCLDEIAIVKARNSIAGGEVGEAARWLAEVTHDADLREVAGGMRRALARPANETKGGQR